MAFAETKVYFDGSHYIAIPHTTRPKKVKYEPLEKVKKKQKEANESKEIITEGLIEVKDEDLPFEVETPPERESPTDTSDRERSPKEVFEELYDESKEMKKYERRSYLIKGMRDYFATDEDTKLFVLNNLERKQRNLTARKVRMWRKINLQEFNYFCTFTYDDKKHSEESFRKSLQSCLRNFCHRKGWKYIGVWERSPEKKRLHFHGIFYIPEGTLSENVPVNDYNLRTHRRQITYQNPYFNSRFGRSDFEEINTQADLNEMMRYIIKYLEKTGEKLIYSKGLPQFFISDILDEDVAGRIGIEDKKLLLFDDFSCWDQGEYIGQVSPTVISKLRKVN